MSIPKNISLQDQIPEIPYLRIGTTYYKLVLKVDQNERQTIELKVWKKDTIVEDHGKKILEDIPKYDDFVLKPDNVNFQPVINNCYNLYSPFKHKPRKGDWIWTERLMRHVFGEQYDLGMRYMQILYLHPTRSTIILSLVSKQRETGKTTFLNYLDMLFGQNLALISSSDFQSSFNGSYGSKLILAIEEALLEKTLSIEKLKSLATQKFITVNEKFVAPYKLPFYGKLVLASNNEDKFAKIDQEEIRFLVRKLGKPEFKNHDIETDLLREIPAFLHHLQTLPPVDWTVSRSGFTPEELHNDSLDKVVKESRSWLCKDLEILIQDHFQNNDFDSFFAAPKDIRDKFFINNNKVELNFIRRVLRDEMKMEPEEKAIRYTAFNEALESVVGRPYTFERSNFVTK